MCTMIVQQYCKNTFKLEPLSAPGWTDKNDYQLSKKVLRLVLQCLQTAKSGSRAAKA